jgi:hypothetical protein
LVQAKSPEPNAAPASLRNLGGAHALSLSEPARPMLREERSAPVSLSRIVMRLARNPGTEFADGDDHRGYTLTAPLTDDGHIDEAAFKAARERCTVRRFAPDEDAQMGRLARRGQTWVFDYGPAAFDPESVFRLGEHRFAVGEYVAIADADERALTYKVTEVQPAA